MARAPSYLVRRERIHAEVGVKLGVKPSLGIAVLREAFPETSYHDEMRPETNPDQPSAH